MGNPTYVTPPQEAELARGSKILLKIVMTQILLELQSLDESKIERTLEGLSMIKSNMTTGINLTQIIQQHLGFLLEYLLNVLLYHLQNRRSTIITRLSVEIQVHLLEHAVMKESI
jgi:hypothetical protein